MGSTLVSYGTGEGQTATVTDRIGDAFVEGRLGVRPPETDSGN